MPTRRMIPACLATDLVQIGVACEGLQALWRELVPGMAKRVHDGVISGEQPVAEVALAQVEPHALDCASMMPLYVGFLVRAGCDAALA